MTTAVKGPWFDVPANTRADRCKSCGHRVYWIRTASDKPMPVDCDVDGGRVPLLGVTEDTGRGIAHFATCVHADNWRRRV